MSNGRYPCLIFWWPATVWHVDMVSLTVSRFHVLCYASEGRWWVTVGITVGRISVAVCDRRSAIVGKGKMVWSRRNDKRDEVFRNV